jgi:hypothetical protein
MRKALAWVVLIASAGLLVYFVAVDIKELASLLR